MKLTEKNITDIAQKVADLLKPKNQKRKVINKKERSNLVQKMSLEDAIRWFDDIKVKDPINPDAKGFYLEYKMEGNQWKKFKYTDVREYILPMQIKAENLKGKIVTEIYTNALKQMRAKVNSRKKQPDTEGNQRSIEYLQAEVKGYTKLVHGG